MPASFAPAATALARLRRSALGAWLAVAYALALLAAGLAPAPASAASAGLPDALLCSGAAAPGSEAPEPAGEIAHCKGCPLNPVLAGPASAGPAIAVRATEPVALPRPPAVGLKGGWVTGLPGSRAPPVPAARS